MTTNYLQLTIPVNSVPAREMLIAQLSFLNFEGFEEEKDAVKAFIKEADFDEKEFEAFIQSNSFTYSKSIIQNRNWNAEWEAGFTPVYIKQFCQVRGSFHPAKEGIEYDIVINPKMSFGTGHHATTFLMIDSMSELKVKGKDVFDFGTGTGVLAILAAKMAAATVIAIDNDSWSIENAKENIELNNCPAIQVYEAEVMPANSKFDIILANINRHVILEHLLNMKQHLTATGVVLLSGLLKSDEELVVKKAIGVGLQVVNIKEQEDWICLKMVNS